MEKQIKYSIDYPVAAEIIIKGEDTKMAEFCLNGLKLAVSEQKMPPEKAREYYNQWFGLDYEFNSLAEDLKSDDTALD